MEPGTLIVFTLKKKLRFGVIAKYDFHTNEYHINTEKGKVTANARTSQFANISMINKTFIKNQILLNKLKE